MRACAYGRGRKAEHTHPRTDVIALHKEFRSFFYVLLLQGSALQSAQQTHPTDCATREEAKSTAIMQARAAALSCAP